LAYFSVRREPRRVSEAAERNGPRSAYLGSEAFLSLVDGTESPWLEGIEQLSIDMLATNRDLPSLMPVSGHHDFTIDSSSQLRFANIVRGPTKPRASVAERELTWRLISHLSLNYLALKNLDEVNGAVAIRELLGLYGSLADPLVARHGESINSAVVRPITRRLPGDGPLVYGRGVSIALSVDEDAFAGHSPFLFGSVLEQYFCRHVSINLFTELTLTGRRSGQIAYWGPRWGGRPDV
jgi:type VI secretion system protein ImpG